MCYNPNFNEYHQSENQKDIHMFQMTNKNSTDLSIFQSTINRPVMITSGVLTGVVITAD